MQHSIRYYYIYIVLLHLICYNTYIALRTKHYYFLIAFVTLFLLSLDLFAKKWALSSLDYAYATNGFGPVNYIKAHNTGVALGLLGNSSIAPFLLTFLGFLIIIFMSRLLDKNLRSALALGTVLGGALGNFLDRIVHGSITDFIVIGSVTNNTLIFNLADLMIFIGSILIVVLVYKDSKKRMLLESQETQ